MEVVGALGAAACCCACVLGMCMLSSKRCTECWKERRRRHELLLDCTDGHYTDSEKSPCQNETCPICLEDFHTGSRIVITPCRHGFHKECLVICLENSPHCPFCKAIVTHKTSISTDHTETDPLIF